MLHDFEHFLTLVKLSVSWNGILAIVVVIILFVTFFVAFVIIIYIFLDCGKLVVRQFVFWLFILIVGFVRILLGFVNAILVD